MSDNGSVGTPSERSEGSDNANSDRDSDYESEDEEWVICFPSKEFLKIHKAISFDWHYTKICVSYSRFIWTVYV